MHGPCPRRRRAAIGWCARRRGLHAEPLNMGGVHTLSLGGRRAARKQVPLVAAEKSRGSRVVAVENVRRGCLRVVVTRRERLLVRLEPFLAEPSYARFEVVVNKGRPPGIRRGRSAAAGHPPIASAAGCASSTASGSCSVCASARLGARGSVSSETDSSGVSSAAGCASSTAPAPARSAPLRLGAGCGPQGDRLLRRKSAAGCAPSTASGPARSARLRTRALVPSRRRQSSGVSSADGLRFSDSVRLLLGLRLFGLGQPVPTPRRQTPPAPPPPRAAILDSNRLLLGLRVFGLGLRLRLLGDRLLRRLFRRGIRLPVHIVDGRPESPRAPSSART